MDAKEELDVKEEMDIEEEESVEEINHPFDNMIISHMDSSVSYYAFDRKMSDLLVFGYIKSLLSIIKQKVFVPKDLIIEFVKFYYEAMPTFLINSDGAGCIDYENFEFYRDGEFDDEILKDKTYFGSQYGFIKGIYKFNVEINKLPNGSIGIGLISDLNGFVQFGRKHGSYQDDWAHDWAFDSKRAGYSYQIFYDNSHRLRQWFYDGIYVHDHGQQTLNQKLKIKWNENDVVGFIIDCDNSRLMFMINDKQVGDAVCLEEDTKYYPAVAIGGDSQVKLKFVECESVYVN